MSNMELIQSVDKSYGIAVRNASVLRDGSDNVVWILNTQNGKKIIARVSKREMNSNITFEAEWLRFLKSKKVPVIPPIESKIGEAYAVSSDGGAITVFEFVNGKGFPFDKDNPPPHKAVASAAKALAELHNASRGYTVSLPRQRTIYTELERAVTYEDKVTEKMPGGAKFMREVKEALALKDSSTAVLLHNDYHIGNLLFRKNNTVAAILDFDWCCAGPAIKDVSHSLVIWSLASLAKTHWSAIFDNFLESYNNAAQEKIANDECLHQWIAFSCLSDACTYLIDRLEHSKIKTVASCHMYQKFRYFSSIRQHIEKKARL